MELREVVEDLPTLGLRGDPRTPIGGVTHDSRRVEPGSLFCCIPGERSDGHDFAPAAVSAGAAALLVERWLDGSEGSDGTRAGAIGGVAQVRVPRVRDAIGEVAARVHGRPSERLAVVGVTGTNGKTTSTYVLESLARAAGRVPGVVGTVEARIDGEAVPGALTTPEAPDLQALLARMAASGVELVAMEVSSHALALGRVRGTRFAAGVFTNLSHDHLDFHGTAERYFEAKASLFVPEAVDAAVLNVEDARGRELLARARRAGVETVAFAGGGPADRPAARSVGGAAGPGVGEGGADVWAEEVELTRAGTALTLHAPRWGRAVRVRSPLVGSFNVSNVVAAAAAALAVGIPLDAVAGGLERPVTVPGRFERVERGQAFTVLVDYAHTPDALARSLAAARELAGDARLVVVFGCGGDRDRAKRPQMGRVAARYADLVHVTSDNPRSEDPRAIADEVLAGVPPAARPAVDLDRRSAIAGALAAARPGDVVVVAGKGHETGQTVGGEVLPFDDRAVVAEVLEGLGCG